MEIKVQILETAEGETVNGAPFKSYRVMILIEGVAFRKTFTVFTNRNHAGDTWQVLRVAEKGGKRE